MIILHIILIILFIFFNLIIPLYLYTYLQKEEIRNDDKKLKEHRMFSSLILFIIGIITSLIAHFVNNNYFIADIPLIFLILLFLFKIDRLLDFLKNKPDQQPNINKSGNWRKDYKKITRKILADSKKNLKPLEDIALAIVTFSVECLEKAKPHIIADNEQSRIVNEMHVYYEFVYFFMALMLKGAFIYLSAEQFKKLNNYLIETVAKSSVDSYVGHLPEEMKIKIRSEFNENLENRIQEYLKCSIRRGKENIPPEQDLFARVALNVSKSSNNYLNIELMKDVGVIAMIQMNNMNLPGLFEKASKVL